MLAFCTAKVKMDAYVTVAKTLVLHYTDKHWLLKPAHNSKAKKHSSL